MKELAESIQVLWANDPQALKSYLLAFGAFAPLLSFCLMLLQALVAPLPAFAISLGNGMLFGGFWGGTLSLVSGVAAAWVCYELARYFGQDWVKSKLGTNNFTKAQTWIDRWGLWALVLLRLIPFLPFDPLSYLLGLSPMRRGRFLAANLIGQAPGAFFYASVGAGIFSL